MSGWINIYVCMHLGTCICAYVCMYVCITDYYCTLWQHGAAGIPRHQESIDVHSCADAGKYHAPVLKAAIPSAVNVVRTENRWFAIFLNDMDPPAKIWLFPLHRCTIAAYFRSRFPSPQPIARKHNALKHACGADDKTLAVICTGFIQVAILRTWFGVLTLAFQTKLLCCVQENVAWGIPLLLPRASHTRTLPKPLNSQNTEICPNTKCPKIPIREATKP